MTQVADDAALGKLSRQLHDVFERVCKGSKTPEEVSRALVRFVSTKEDERAPVVGLSRAWKVLWCDGLEIPELISRVAKLGTDEHRLDKVRHLSPLHEEFVLFHSTPRAFGFKTSPEWSVFVSVLRKQGFDLCPQSLGLYLRLADQDQSISPDSDDGVYWVASTPFHSSEWEGNYIFSLRRHSRYGWLMLGVEELGKTVRLDSRFVFQRQEK